MSRSRGRVLGGTILGGVGLLAMLSVSPPTLWQQYSHTALGETGCLDDWATPGFMWYGSGPLDIRYMPYDRLEALSNTTAAGQLDPAQHFDQIHDNAFPQQGETIEYSKLFRTSASRQAAGNFLDFLQNKHIAILGSSLDREAVRHFCDAHQGAQKRDVRHRYTICHWPDNNFTVSLWHSYGLHQTSWWGGADAAENGKILEDRLDRVFIPETQEKTGQPDLLIFTSGLWDIKYLHTETVRHIKGSNEAGPPALTFNELLWHRSRLEQVIEKLQSAFPKAFIMYRTTTTAPATISKVVDYPVSVSQINQSARALMKKLKIPLFHWESLIIGDEAEKLSDQMHYRPTSRANWLYGEMLLWHLKEVTGEHRHRDKSCWLDR